MSIVKKMVHKLRFGHSASNPVNIQRLNFEITSQSTHFYGEEMACDMFRMILELERGSVYNTPGVELFPVSAVKIQVGKTHL